MNHISRIKLSLTLSIATMLFPSLAIAEDVVVKPKAAEGPVDNPLKGWCPYSNDPSIQQKYSMVYLYVPWKDVEPEEGKFAFDRWEKAAWNTPQARGKHVVLRLYIDYPSLPSGLPTWLEKDVKTTQYKDHGGGFSPDYDNPRMVAAMERLIDAFGRRYNNNPRVAFIELGLLGFWGEWHTYPRHELYAKPETEAKVIAAYHRAFPDKMLMARYARDDAAKQTWLGFHDDMFPEDTDNGQDWSFLAGIRRAGRDRNWEHAAIGGEMVPGKSREWLGEGFAKTLDMVERSHFSWVGPANPSGEPNQSREFRQRSRTLVQKMGYQYKLTEIRHPKSVSAKASAAIVIKGVNEGVAPFYYAWPVELALIDASRKPIARLALKADPRAWLPGEFEINEPVVFDAKPGSYRLAFGIIDPWTHQPAIRFANQLPTRSGWAELSTITITKP